MRSSISLSFYTFISINLFQAGSAVVLEGRDPAAARTTAYPTVPSFSAPAFTYQAFSEAYPSGYTLATTPFIKISARSSAIPTSSDSRASRPSESARASYVKSMCAPYYDLNLSFPCNRVANTSRTCVYNATLDDIANARNGGPRLRPNSPQEQHDCLCPGGKGENYWEYIEGCDECRRLHGAYPLDETDDDDAAFIPKSYDKAISSAYCAQKTASEVWTDYAEHFFVTHPIVYDTDTGGTDYLRSKTAVSNYFTETSGMTPVITTITKLRQNPSTSQTPITLKPASTSKTSTSSAATAATAPTGGATSLRRSGLLGAGLLGVAWVLSEPVDAFITGPYFPWGSEAFTVTTSSHKKRRLSPPEEQELDDSLLDAGTNDLALTNQQKLPLSSPPHISLPDQPSAISSTPRFIPPHLVAEGAGQGRSPTPELPTGASSPSTAYAGLTLDTEAGGEISGAEGRSFARRRSSVVNKEKNLRPALSDRSSSPATKRPAADMEEGNMDGTTDPRESVKEGMPRRKSQTQNSRHMREVSVDMLNNESESSTDQTPLPTVPEASSTSLLRGVYQSPGISISGSNSKEQDNSGLSPASSTTGRQMPSIDDQISKILPMVEAPLVEGQKGYAVSNKWLQGILSKSSKPEEARKYPKEAVERPIGPVDNAGLNVVLDPTMSGLQDEKGDPFVPLLKDTTLDDITIFPQEAWDLIIKWYGLGPGSAIITRYCHNTSDNKDYENMQFELNPPVFTILKLPEQSGGPTSSHLADKNSRPVKIVASRQEVFQKFLRRAKQLANIDLKVKVRVWKLSGNVEDTAKDGIITPVDSRDTSPSPGILPMVDPGQSLVLENETFANLERRGRKDMLDVKDETANEKYNGRSTLSLVGLLKDEVLVLEEQVGGPAGGEWRSDLVQHKANGIPVSISNSGDTIVKGNLKPKLSTASGRTSPAPSTGIMTRGRAQKTGKTRGTVGLGNLGNTCYMNSALQCLRSVPELAPYFLSGKYKKELNMDNPLGYKGMVAKAYAALLGEIYGESNKSTFSPHSFKNVVGRNAPAFSGYGQQDSQEFLGWLLSALDEDLNRILKKPYIEKPDSTDEMIHNPVALQNMADKCWDIYKARNDSVITELFAGMYKSTVACPECTKISIIFDPFTTFTLQLPIESPWYHDIYFFPLYSPPVLVKVDVDKSASMMAVREFLGKRFGSDPKKMIVFEIYRHRCFKAFDDSTSIAEERPAENDAIAVYELSDTPTNWPAPTRKVQKKALSFHKFHREEEVSLDDDPSIAEKMLVAVYHRKPKPSGSRSDLKEVFGVPSFIMLNPEEASDYDTILRKVLVNVQSMTTMNILAVEEDIDTEDSDTVLMSNEEVNNSDLKVQAQSVDSEDGIVDVSMRDEGDTQGENTKTSGAQYSKGRVPPSILRSGSPINPQLRNLFDMQVFSAGPGQTIPSGFNILNDETTTYPSMTDRIPKPKLSMREKTSRRVARLGSASSSEEDAVVSAAPRPTNVFGSDSDSDTPAIEALTQPDRSNQSRFSTKAHLKKRRLITYSRKGKRSNIDESSQTPATDSPLIKPGEAILLDWTPEAYDSLFGGLSNSDDDLRGVETHDQLYAEDDPALQERKKKREKRRKSGITLDDCLDEFAKPETLSENDAWFCPQCQKHRRATKTFELWKCPDILVIHLKRFSSSSGRFQRDKLDIFVDFPVEGLDLTSRIALHEENKSAIYDLFAVDNHYGTLGGGHYTAYAKNADNGLWYDYNDSTVRRVEPRQVVNSSAYLLFYRRRSDKCLGGPFLGSLSSEESAGSPPGSRTASPSGEGRRLDDSSRNGSSSAFPGAEAVHQAGGGGTTGIAQRTGVDDDLPAYGPLNEPISGLEPIEIEEDEGIGMEETAGFHAPTISNEPNWSFDNVPGRWEDDPPTYVMYDGGDGSKDGNVWRDIGGRRNSNDSTAVTASPLSSRDHDEDIDPPIHFIDASDAFANTDGSAGAAGVRGQDNTPVDEIDAEPMLEDTERKHDQDGDTKMD